MTYKPKRKILGPLFFAILVIVSLVVFNKTIFSDIRILLLEIVLICGLIANSWKNFMKIDINNGVVATKQFGFVKWSVPITEIAAIDDTQNKNYFNRPSVLISRHPGSMYIGFMIKTTSNKILTMPYAIPNYPDFLNELKSQNPNLQITKLTESVNQPLVDIMDKPL